MTRAGRGHQVYRLEVLAVVIQEPHRAVCAVPGGRRGRGGRRGTGSRAAAGGGDRAGQQRAGPRAQPVLHGQEVRLETVVTAGVDQGEALVGVGPQRRDVGLGQRRHRSRPLIARLQQVGTGHAQRDDQPQQRDHRGNRSQHQARVEHPVGAPEQPPLRAEQRVADDGGDHEKDQGQRQPGRLPAGRRQLAVRLRGDLTGGRQQRAAHQARCLPQVGRPQGQAEPVVGPGGLHLAGVDGKLSRQRCQVPRGGRMTRGRGGALQVRGRLGDVRQVMAAGGGRLKPAGQERGGLGGVRVRQCPVDLLAIQAQRFAGADHIVGPRRALAHHPGRYRAPHQGQQDQPDEEQPQLSRRPRRPE